MQLGAHLAGLAIEQSMLGAAHACANPLTARFGLTHGVALAILLPHVVRWNGRIAARRLRGAARLAAPPRARQRRGRDARPPRSRTSPSPARCRRGCPTSGVTEPALPRARGARRPAVDRHVQSAAVRCGGGARDLRGRVLTAAPRAAGLCRRRNGSAGSRIRRVPFVFASPGRDRQQAPSSRTERRTNNPKDNLFFRSLRWLRCSVLKIRCLDIPRPPRGQAPPRTHEPRARGQRSHHP